MGIILQKKHIVQTTSYKGIKIDILKWREEGYNDKWKMVPQTWFTARLTLKNGRKIGLNIIMNRYGAPQKSAAAELKLAKEYIDSKITKTKKDIENWS